MPQVVFLYGPAASGKLTIAKALAEQTGFALFHNHLTVDLLSAVFPFGSAEFIRHREAIWMGVITDAVRTGRSLVFTFHPEASVAADFPRRLAEAVRSAGGTLCFVRIQCDEAEIRRRLTAASRVGAKLTDLAFHDRLKAQGAFSFPELPADLTVDSTSIPAAENARQVAAFLELSAGRS